MSILVEIAKVGARLILVLATFACGRGEPPSQVKTPSKPRAVRGSEQLDANTFVILPFNKKPDYLFNGAKPAGLSEPELNTVNTLLEKCVAEHNEAQEKEFRDMMGAHPEIPFKKERYFISLPAYKRQLIAVTDARGEKQVWVNCFCEGSESYWRKEVVDVDDGGNCFFNVKINLTQATWYDMMVNGSA
ncbi:hypothetical protein [Hymenobacter sp.]|uniref:hypothetical protein n=1 Tax=Hymenobacter sp. TaxID=1898978 RepID=UPI00286D5576|nr:hypothetical protein [Hymenobacter sp.]